MKKLRIILIINIIISAIALGGCNMSEVDHTILKAVPNDAGLIIKTSKLQNICATLNSGNMMWEQLRSIPSFKEAENAINVIDTTVRGNQTMRSLLHDKDMAISFHKEGKDNICPLLAINISTAEAKDLLMELASLAKANNLQPKNYKYDNTSVFILMNGKKETMVFSYVDNVFVVSTSKLETEKAVRHIHSRNSLGNNQKLKQLLKTEGKNAQGVLIVNYANFYELVKSELNSQEGLSTSKIARIAEWSVLDLNIDKQNVTMAGFTNSKSGEGQYIRTFHQQQPINNNFVKYLPSKTSSFTSIGIKDISKFKDDFSDYLKEKDQYNNLKTFVGNFKKKYGIELDVEFYALMGQRITEFSCDYSLAGRAKDSYIIAELENDEAMDNMMRRLCDKLAKEKGLQEKDAIVNFTSGTKKKYNIYRVPTEYIFGKLFGKIFTCEPTHFTIVDGKGVFGRGVKAIEEYINSMDRRKVLSANSNYAEFANMVDAKSNIFFYADIAYSQTEIKGYLNKSNAEIWNKNANKFTNFRSMALQYSSEDDNTFYTSGAMMYSAILEDERYTSWISPTDTIVAMKPQIVKNHTNNEREILVQSETSKLYLINKDGKVQWTKQLPEPITSQISQIDYFQNGNLQYLFATENFLYLIDRKGNIMENYPVHLPAMVSAEISVFDYDNNGAYRIFVPCSNRRLYLYGKDGKMLEGWTPIETKESLITPVQHFRINENDYLISADILRTYIWNRRGEIRINVTSSFPKSKNSLFYLETLEDLERRFVTSNSSGEIQYIYMDGSCKSKSIKHYSAEHTFVLQDIDGDGANEYIFSNNDLLEVFGNDGKLKFSKYHDGNISRPTIFKFSANDVRIGVTCRSTNRIYLYDNKGNICGGFPLQGSSEFSITRLNSPTKYSVVTGGADNYIYNYLIQ